MSDQIAAVLQRQSSLSKNLPCQGRRRGVSLPVQCSRQDIPLYPEDVKKFKTGGDREGEAPAEPHRARTCWADRSPGGSPSQFFHSRSCRRSQYERLLREEGDLHISPSGEGRCEGISCRADPSGSLTPRLSPPMEARRKKTSESTPSPPQGERVAAGQVRGCIGIASKLQGSRLDFTIGNVLGWLVTILLSWVPLMAQAAPESKVVHHLPKLSSVFPQGSEPGQTLRLEVLGEFLDRASAVVFLDTSIQGRILESHPTRAELDGKLTHGGGPLNPSAPAHAGIFNGEVKQLERRIVVAEAAAGFDDLAQRAVQRLDRVGGVDHLADAGREREERK